MALALVLLSFGACKERLDLQPLTDTEASYFTEEVHFERAILGVYAKMSDWYWYNNNNIIHSMWHLPGDDITTNGNYPFEVFVTLQPGVGELNTYFRTAYQLIARANVVIQKIGEENGVITTPGLKNAILGEAYFLRAHAYFNLWNFYGTSPLVTERIQTQDKIQTPSSSGTELIDQAIEDFTTAADLLPTAWGESDRGRVTKNSANAYLGKVLVFRAGWTNNAADYQAALTAFNKISGLSLVPNYADNFSVINENNAESLFEYQAGQPSYDNVWLSNDFNQGIGSFSAYWGFYDDHWSFWAHTPFIVSQKFVNAIDPDDPRKGQIFDEANRRILKYVVQNQLSQSGVGSVNNPRILRYADVLLLKAEALNETGQGALAVAEINKVRERARNMGATGEPADRPTGAGKDEIRQFIDYERMVELCGEEGHRWFDLRRWHKAGWISLNTAFFSSDMPNIDFDVNKHLFFPIPNNETDLNPNIVQNPGY
jgi:starch-binding outer membrane protein, SusD/RagB family